MSSSEGRWRTNQSTVTCVNEDVLDARGYRIWLSMAIDEAPHSSPILRRLYARRGYRSETEAGFKNKSVTDEVVFGASRANSVVGTIAVRIDSPAGLRAAVRYADVVDALRHERRKLCELDRVALARGQDAMEILGALIRVASLYAGDVRGATDLLIEVHPQHVETYRRVLGLLVADHEPRVLLGIPRALLRLEIAQLDAQAASGRTDPADGGFPGGVLTAHELEEAARRIQDTVAAACAPLLTARSFEFESPAGPRVDNIRPAPPPLSVAANHTGAQFDSKTYDEGLRAGVQARLHKQRLTAYQRVGLDEFARGSRAGFFAKSAGVQMSEAGDGRAAV